METASTRYLNANLNYYVNISKRPSSGTCPAGTTPGVDLEASSGRRAIEASRCHGLCSSSAPLDDDDVRGIEAPTLLLAGGRSIPLFHRLMNRLEELLPHAERVEIPGATHLVHEDNAPAYNAAVLSFLASLDGTP